MASRIAKIVADQLREDGYKSVGWGDGWVLDKVGDLVNVKNPHPLNRMRAVFSHLERATDLFEKTYRRSMNSRGAEVRVRVFRLRGE